MGFMVVVPAAAGGNGGRNELFGCLMFDMAIAENELEAAKVGKPGVRSTRADERWEKREDKVGDGHHVGGLDDGTFGKCAGDQVAAEAEVRAMAVAATAIEIRLVNAATNARAILNPIGNAWLGAESHPDRAGIGIAVRVASVFLDVSDHGEGELAKVVRALRRLGAFFGFTDRWEEKSGEDADDREDNQQFDESEGKLRTARSCH